MQLKAFNDSLISAETNQFTIRVSESVCRGNKYLNIQITPRLGKGKEIKKFARLVQTQSKDDKTKITLQLQIWDSEEIVQKETDWFAPLLEGSSIKYVTIGKTEIDCMEDKKCGK